jgi:DNA-binding Lrp family transcriptional regulator
MIDPAALGHPLTIVVEVEVESKRIDLLDSLKRRFSECPHVQQCYYVAGKCDFVLIMTVKNMDQYNNLTNNLF